MDLTRRQSDRMGWKKLSKIVDRLWEIGMVNRLSNLTMRHSRVSWLILQWNRWPTWICWEAKIICLSCEIDRSVGFFRALHDESFGINILVAGFSKRFRNPETNIKVCTSRWKQASTKLIDSMQTCAFQVKLVKCLRLKFHYKILILALAAILQF